MNCSKQQLCVVQLELYGKVGACEPRLVEVAGIKYFADVYVDLRRHIIDEIEEQISNSRCSPEDKSINSEAIRREFDRKIN